MPRRKRKTMREKSTSRVAAFEMASEGKLVWPEALKILRLSVDMTQAQFGEMVKLTPRQMSEFETGKANPNVETLNRIGRPFGLQVGLVLSKK